MERLNGCGKSSAHLHAADMQRTRTVRIVSAGACGLRDFRGSLSPDLVLKSPNESAICRDLGVFSDSGVCEDGGYHESHFQHPNSRRNLCTWCLQGTNADWGERSTYCTCGHKQL